MIYKSLLRCTGTLFLIALLLSGCSRIYERQDAVGKVFPSVHAEVLTGQEVVIPEYFEGENTLLLVGYIQDSQFDIDRWLLALKQLKTSVPIAELPTITGIFPRMISSKINSGMRSGIPEEDWKIVFTIYKDAESVTSFLGNANPRNARVVLIDEKGVVLWFYDRGFSVGKATELDTLIKELN